MRLVERRCVSAISVLAVCAAPVVVPLGRASASVLSATCTFDQSSRQLTVRSFDQFNTISIRREESASGDTDAIRIFENDPPETQVACHNTPSGTTFVPTLTNVDSISIHSAVALELDLSRGDLSPGATPEEGPGASEVEVSFSPPAGLGRVGRVGIRATDRAAPAVWRAGTIGDELGVNLNSGEEEPAKADVDLRTTSNVGGFTFGGTNVDDVIDARGGREFNAPLPVGFQAVGATGDDALTAGTGSVSIDAGAGNDLIDGGPDDDFLQEGPGDDELLGSGGADTIFADTGNDVLDAGAGPDGLSFFFARGPIWADLRESGVQDAGAAGFDSYRGFEGLNGSGVSDVLIGDEGSNWIQANPGADLVAGLGGGDSLDGASGKDLMLGGDGDDRLVGLGEADRLSGGPGDDTIGGHDGPDELVGGDGADRLFGGDQRDRLLARDGVRDATVDCGDPKNIQEGLRRDKTDPRAVGCLNERRQARG